MPAVRFNSGMERGARDQAALLPRAPGVYRFRDAQGRILYLGRATALRGRVASYWGDLRDRAHLAPMVARVARVEAVVCDSVHEAAWLERNLLQAAKPPWNRAPDGGQEAEVWIRLGGGTSAPGIAVVHAPAAGMRNFGPYLGGRQVRLAVSGLCRVLPLNYAGGELAGTRHELARIRGADAAGHALLTRQAAAVLDRDPAAVGALRARLVERRDAASASLAFEFAGKLQQEIEALDWVTAQQKVTRPGGPDQDVCGWSDGILVSFALRAGRLAGWTQRPCGEPAARRRLAATPPEWTAFARRTATLAARLALGCGDADDRR